MRSLDCGQQIPVGTGAVGQKLPAGETRPPFVQTWPWRGSSWREHIPADQLTQLWPEGLPSAPLLLLSRSCPALGLLGEHLSFPVAPLG